MGILGFLLTFRQLEAVLCLIIGDPTTTAIFKFSLPMLKRLKSTKSILHLDTPVFATSTIQVYPSHQDLGTRGGEMTILRMIASHDAFLKSRYSIIEPTWISR